MKFRHPLVLCLAAVLTGAGTVAAWLWVETAVHEEVFRRSGNPEFALRVSLLLAMLVPLLLPAYPLAALFKARAWMAGLLIGWPAAAYALWSLWGDLSIHRAFSHVEFDQ